MTWLQSLVLAVVLLTVPTFAADSQSSGEARRIMQDALVALAIAADSDNFEAVEAAFRKAEAEYGRALRARPGYVPALLAMGFMREVKGDYEGARRWFRQAHVRLKPGATADLVHRELDVLDDAVRSTASAAGRKERQYHSQVGGALAYRAIGLNALALRRALWAIDLSDDARWEGFAAAAQVAVSVGQIEDAVILYRAAAARADPIRRGALTSAVANLSMPRPFKFGMSVNEANSLLPRPVPNASWETLERRTRVRTSGGDAVEVRYLQNRLSEFQNLPFAEIYASCTAGAGVLTLLFDEQGLFRVLLGFPSACGDHRTYVEEVARQMGARFGPGEVQDGRMYFSYHGDGVVMSGVADRAYSAIQWTDARSRTPRYPPW